MEPTEKELLQRTLQISEDTNRMVHKLRRGMWWGRVTTVLFWLVITLGPVVAFFYFQSYISPYTQMIQQYTSQLQQGAKQTQDYQTQISNFFANWVPHSTSTSTSTSQH